MTKKNNGTTINWYWLWLETEKVFPLEIKFNTPFLCGLLIVKVHRIGFGDILFAKCPYLVDGSAYGWQVIFLLFYFVSQCPTRQNFIYMLILWIPFFSSSLRSFWSGGSCFFFNKTEIGNFFFMDNFVVNVDHKPNKTKIARDQEKINNQSNNVRRLIWKKTAFIWA